MSTTRSSRALKKIVRRYSLERWRNRLARPGVHSFVVVLDHLKAGFNIPKIFRSADAMGAREVHLVGVHPFDPAPAKGSFRKVPARFHDTIGQCLDDLRAQGYTLFAMDSAAPRTVGSVEFPERSAFIVGHEEFGVSFQAADHPDVQFLRIPQFGSVNCLNVSIAATLVMYEYVRQHALRSESADTEDGAGL